MRSHLLLEERLLHTPESEVVCASHNGLRRIMEEETVLEGAAQLCDGTHNPLVSIGPFTGFLPREEAALGIAEGTTWEIAILSRVGKPIYFQITALGESEGVLRPRLSRRRAQQAVLDTMLTRLHPGYIPPAVVTYLKSFGAFVNISCGVPSLVGIEDISVSRIPHPDQRLRAEQAIFAVVQELDPKPGRVYLIHRELLGTWTENAARSQAGMTVSGIVRRLKEYGAFAELTPSLSGPAGRESGLRKGDRMSVYIRTALSERMRVKLLTIDTLPPLNVPVPLEYFLTQGQVEKWKYVPEGCVKVGVEAIFA